MQAEIHFYVNTDNDFHFKNDDRYFDKSNNNWDYSKIIRCDNNDVINAITNNLKQFKLRYKTHKNFIKDFFNKKDFEINPISDKENESYKNFLDDIKNERDTSVTLLYGNYDFEIMVYFPKPKVDRETFMEFFRSESYCNMLSVDDKREVFLGSLAGSSDITKELLEELLSDYDVGNLTISEVIDE